jgi:hypothetical protein
MKPAGKDLVDRMNAAAAETDETEQPATDSATSETPQPDAQPTVEIDGQKFTLDQVREFRQGYMKDEDYRRKTQELATDRETIASERKALQGIIDRYEAQLKNLTGSTAEPTADDIELTPALKVLRDNLKKEIEAVQNEVKSIREERQEREQQAEQVRVDNLIVETADKRIRELMTEHKLPEKAFAVIQKVIAMSDPDLYDPVTKELNEQSVRAAISRQFTTVLPDLNVLRGVQGLKVEPAKKAAAPATNPKAEEKPPEEPKRARRPDPFAGSAEELQDKIAAAIGGSGQDYV